jgi:hypothetical protein
LNYTRSLKFEEKPDYLWIKRLFKDLFDKYDYKYDLIFEWGLVATVNKIFI